MRDTRRTRIVLSLLLVLSLSIVVLNLRGNGEGPRSTAGGVLGPLENSAAAIVRPVSSFLASISTLGTKDDTIAALRAENDRLRSEQTTSGSVASRAAQLDDLLRIAGLGQLKTVPAQVIAVGAAQGFSWTVTIDAGRIDGVKAETTVLTGRGLVGKVVSVSSTTSVVLLIVDPSSTVAARVEGSNTLALLNGAGDPQALSLELYDRTADLKVGDRLVKWGNAGSPYAAGVPLGEVTAVSVAPGGGRVGTVRPYADVFSLDLVGVVISTSRTDPRDALLPPRPTPSRSSQSGPAASPSTTPLPSSTR